ncbi:MAG TPA: cisplatin damage response ATP-dependent DNA ligase [Acidocella sp.]|uniref:cisplatin damage response ATP-dependent DNA ligase n=1 Tax=Acidocella sp. TaxID=50710 RepID=UPI002B83DE78|nr:cisplatin damage response ATP-dependent DNA ligase [Acidocella sp.]HVE21615.1 cisplatin damage response ATP-dependent DNA ligase [Acidocella sp.]
MKAFAELLERLLYAPARNTKIALLLAYFTGRPDPERGYALAAIAGALDFPGAKPAVLKALAQARTDPFLFELSYDFIGDLAETIALIWPGTGTPHPPDLPSVIRALHNAPRDKIPGLISFWLDECDPSTRIALIKLITGGLRVGASLRLAQLALAEMGGVEVQAVEEVWHGLEPPYEDLFSWLEGKGAKPDTQERPVFRPVMLAHPLEAPELSRLDWAAHRAEWKWDGVRVQLVATPYGKRLYTRTADDISSAFPEILEAMNFHAVLDGELLVIRDGAVAPFSDLQQRLGRKIVSAAFQAKFPVGVRLYDILFDGVEDLRARPFDARRARLEAWFAMQQPARMDLSSLIAFTGLEDLAALREGAREAAIEGLMLKLGDSPYLAGRPKGAWWKWKRAPLSLDAVLMYAQRGHGKRSSYYSDYTFGVWNEKGELVPVGKAYSGYSDEELIFIDRWIRNHTTQRFGPVREVEKCLVFEVGFDAAQLSTRHKSGVALRFPRILRLRTDKPAAEADRLETVRGFIV